MGRVLLEAMALEKPVIASNVGGILDLVKEGENGFLIPPGNIKALSDSLLKLLKNKNLAKRMGEKGLRFVSDKFSAKTMVNQILSVYVECLDKKGGDLER